MTDLVVRRRKKLAWFICGGLLLLILCFVFAPVHWPSSAVRNERQVVRLLTAARPDFDKRDPSQIERVVLGGHVTLVPDHDQTVVGYVLTLHVRSALFTITATPLHAWETGTFSFFRDESGVVRFEPETGKQANAQSRRWGPALTEKHP